MAGTPLLDAMAAREQLTAAGINSRVVPLDKLDVVWQEDELIVLDGDDGFKLPQRKARTSLKHMAGIDASHFAEYSEDRELVGSMIRHSLRKRKGKQVRLVTRGSSLVEMFSAEHPWLAPTDFFDLVFTTLGSRLLGLASMNFERGSHVNFRFVVDQSKTPPQRVGDVSHAGVWARCNGQIEFGSYVHRLVCTNGMCSDYTVATHKTQDLLQAEVRKQVNTVLESSVNLLYQFTELDQQPVQNPSAFLTNFARTHGVSDRAHRQLAEAVPTLPESATEFDVVNLITARAQQHDNPQFEWLGARAVHSFRDETCTHCSQPLH